MAWQGASLPFLWVPPRPKCMKGNFDKAVRDSFVVAAAVITKKYPVMDALQGEAHASLLASRLAITLGFGNFSLQGDALLVILAINNLSLFFT